MPTLTPTPTSQRNCDIRREASAFQSVCAAPHSASSRSCKDAVRIAFQKVCARTILSPTPTLHFFVRSCKLSYTASYRLILQPLYLSPRLYPSHCPCLRASVMLGIKQSTADELRKMHGSRTRSRSSMLRPGSPPSPNSPKVNLGLVASQAAADYTRPPASPATHLPLACSSTSQMAPSMPWANRTQHISSIRNVTALRRSVKWEQLGWPEVDWSLKK
ncbi:hypothetical protein HETIRDRAFT_460956 [Heterobasidion irregulare TC 32-1]|uniref:Uncharacterized protein n=1 Tax=Heterobasidion irregulare (strain TC 32-1) TaxID=747525 RepID=W4JRC0_HETIT|nr:uncharacterized protein HETIRDRAFT_460956 [Heterobasidion irregulare TC 32-1]ETW75635.1 hypothetical protein HETIRDRAFT_460956 [Heterobasidion irregulare TC 32-1]